MAQEEGTPDRRRQRERVAAGILVGGLLTLTGARLLAEAWWFATCVWSWSWHATLVALLLGLGLWRRPRFLLAIGLAAGLVWWPHYRAGATAAIADPRPAGPDLPQIRLVSANQGFWNEDPALVGTLLASEADVLLLCEANRHAIADLASSGRWPHSRWDGLATGAFGWAVFSSWPIELDTITVQGLSTPLATIRHPDGALRVVAAHPPPPVRQPMLSLRNGILAELIAVLNRADQLPLCIAGDFNAILADPALQRLQAELGLRSCHAGAGSWPAPVPGLGLGIDHQFIGPGVRLIAAGDIDLPGSDHQGLWSEISWDPVPHQSSDR